MKVSTSSNRESSLPACPAPGAGVHSWILSAANRCRHIGIPSAAAEAVIARLITRAPSPAVEIRTAVAKAYATTSSPQRRPSSCKTPNAKQPVPISEVAFDPAKLAAVASRITQPRNWRHWLWERSPKRPETQNSYSFLMSVYRPGETVLGFDRMDSKTPVAIVQITEPMDCRVPAALRAGGQHGSGVWYLCNPVDGRWHPNPRTGNQSCRSEESITSWRYAVLESDAAPADQWLAFLVQLPVRISAIYTSGSRSIHALVRLDAASKHEWNSQIDPLKRPLKVLGADPGCLSGVRLTRLPGCRRPNKGGFQRLLYLSPNPPPGPLIDLPALWDRTAALARWRKLCPRWNPNQAPDQSPE